MGRDALGQFSGKTLMTSIVLLPLAIATNFLGIWLVRITPTEVFYRLAYWLVFFISIALIVRGGAQAAARVNVRPGRSPAFRTWLITP
jgi:uncharacterized protein